jgi:hypothetical protein
MLGTSDANSVTKGLSQFTEIPQKLESVTGVSFIVLVMVAIGLFLLLALIFDSSQGRGRRYRRGYLVAYRETLGKERAKMRVQQEKEGLKKPGWRERLRK